MSQWRDYAIEISTSINGMNYTRMTQMINEKFNLKLTVEEVRTYVQSARGIKRRSYKTTEDETKENKKGKCLGVKQGREEIKPDVFEGDNFFTISFKNKNITVTKDICREMKKLYSEDGLTINAVCRRMEIPRPDFILIKTAFGWTHDDTPYIDEDLKNKSVDELVNETLERKKERYFIQLQEAEITKMKQELSAYRKRDYFYDKVLKGMSVPITPLNFNIMTETSRITEALLNFADWHTGLKVENYWNKYSLAIQRQYIEEIVSKCILFIDRHQVKQLHVMNLGDLLHGIIHTSTRIVAEVDVIEQFRITWQLISQVLTKLAQYVEVVYFYSTYGNHSRITENKTDALDRENLELLLPDILRANLQNIKNIVFTNNEFDDQILVAKPCGHVVFGVHGDRDRNEKVASNLSMMLPLKPKAIFTAHTHHKEVLEVHKIDVIVSRALCGVDDFAKDIRSTSKAGQSLYIFNPESMECTYDITFN